MTEPDDDPMKGKHYRIEERVKKHLDKIAEIDGGWDAMLDVLHRRSIQKQLRETRILKGLTQADVAKRMDITQSTLSEMENARYPDYRLSTLRRWALAVEVHYEWRLFENVVEQDEECEGS